MIMYLDNKNTNHSTFRLESISRSSELFNKN